LLNNWPYCRLVKLIYCVNGFIFNVLNFN
jgi:hypothetical protein